MKGKNSDINIKDIQPSNYSELNMQRDEDGDLSPITYNAIKERINYLETEIKKGKTISFKELEYLRNLLTK